jgi:hypothetical protein
MLGVHSGQGFSSPADLRGYWDIWRCGLLYFRFSRKVYAQLWNGEIMSIYRIMLVAPGVELTLFTYKRSVGDQQVIDKLTSIAHTMFSSWSWGSDIPAIESGNCILMAVKGPTQKECFL